MTTLGSVKLPSGQHATKSSLVSIAATVAPQSSFPQVSDLSLLHWFKLFGPLLPRWHHSLAFHRYLTCHCYFGSNCLVHCCQQSSFPQVSDLSLLHWFKLFGPLLPRWHHSLAFHRYLTCHCYIGSNCLVHCLSSFPQVSDLSLLHWFKLFGPLLPASSFPQVSDLSLLHWFKLFGPLLPRWHHSLAFHRYLTCHCYIGSNCLVHCCQRLAFHRYLTCHCYIGSNCLVHCCQSSFPQVSDLSLLHWFKLFGPLLPRWHHSLAFHRYLTCHCYIGSNCLVHCCQPLAFHRYLTCHCYIGSNCLVHCCHGGTTV